MSEAGEFYFERAEKEHEVAERKRDAVMTKTAAIATLAAALAAIVAAPAFDVAGLADGASRWVLLAAVLSFLAAIGCAAQALTIHVRPGNRVSRKEMDNWTSEEFWLTDDVERNLELTKGFVSATKGIRTATEHAEAWMSGAAAGIAGGLVLMLIAFVVETA